MRGPCEYDEVANTPEDDEGDAEEGSETSEGIDGDFGSPSGSGMRSCFCGEDLLE